MCKKSEEGGGVWRGKGLRENSQVDAVIAGAYAHMVGSSHVSNMIDVRCKNNSDSVLWNKL